MLELVLVFKPDKASLDAGCAITYLEIKAFFDLQGIEPQPEEVDMIVLFDSIAMKVMQEEHKRKLPKEKGKEE